MERELERLKEREPQSDIYDVGLKWMMERTRLRNAGKVLIKDSEVPWVQSRHGYGKHYINGLMWDQVAAPGWMISRTSQQTIRRGKHTHRGGGRLLYALEGRGCTITNDVRLDWEQGDLEILPVIPRENVHEHHNLDPGKPCGMLVLGYWPFMEVVAYETRQMTDSPDWKGQRDEEMYRPEDFVTESAEVTGYDIKVDSPPATLLDDLFLRRNRWREQVSQARWVIKKNDQPVETNRMGIYRWYVHPSFSDVVGRHILFWTHEIPPGSRSGMQKHQGGRIHFVIEGQGYSILDGQRYDWEPGDLLLLPIKSGGVTIQHFNADPETPAMLAVAEPNFYDILGLDMACGFEQIENCPEFRG